MNKEQVAVYHKELHHSPEATPEVAVVLDHNAEQRKGKARTWITGLKDAGIVATIGGFLAAAAGKIGYNSETDAINANVLHPKASDVAAQHDFSNAFNGGLIALAAGFTLAGVGKMIEIHTQKAQGHR